MNNRLFSAVASVSLASVSLGLGAVSLAGCGDDPKPAENIVTDSSVPNNPLPTTDSGNPNGGGTDATAGDSGDAGIVDAAPDVATVDAAPEAAALLKEGDLCNTDGGATCEPGLGCCTPCCDGRPAKCTALTTSNSNDAGIGIGQCPLPDLAVDVTRLSAELGTGPATFAGQGCSVQEGCVGAAGKRKLIHFSVVTPNLGTSDLVLGDPRNNGNFQYAACHDHYHFNGYARYRLLDANGAEVLVGTKRAFCLEDYERQRNPPLGGPARRQFTCDNQGISMGWTDTYYNGLSCQFLDVTNVTPGEYTLEVTVNPERYFEELRYDNNMVRIQVTVPADSASPLDPCSGDVQGTNRECGWTLGETFTCEAGTRVRVGCGATCGTQGTALGSCTGDPMIRVCDGTAACESPGLGTNDDCNNNTNCSATTFTCPTSGQYTVMWGPLETTRAATCQLGHSP